MNVKLVLFVVSLSLLLVLSDSKYFEKRDAEEDPAPPAPIDENQNTTTEVKESVSDSGKVSSTTDMTLDNGSGAGTLTSDAGSSVVELTGGGEEAQPSQQPNDTGSSPTEMVTSSSTGIAEVSEVTVSSSTVMTESSSVSQISVEASSAISIQAEDTSATSPKDDNSTKLVDENVVKNDTSTVDADSISDPVAATSTKKDGNNFSASLIISLPLICVSLYLTTTKHQ